MNMPAELATVLTTATLGHHAVCLYDAGYVNKADLADAEDFDLATLGLSQPEIKRLRREL
jgi:hypothetical protein